MTHDEFDQLTDAYLAGALADDEQTAFESHAAECPACAANLAQARAADSTLDDLFASSRPNAALEDRVISHLREARRGPMTLHPMVRRAAVGVAAALVLGAVGFVVSNDATINRYTSASKLAQNVLRDGVFREGADEFVAESPRVVSRKLVEGLAGGLQGVPAGASAQLGMTGGTSTDPALSTPNDGTRVQRFFGGATALTSGNQGIVAGAQADPLPLIAGAVVGAQNEVTQNDAPSEGPAPASAGEGRTSSSEERKTADTHLLFNGDELLSAGADFTNAPNFSLNQNQAGRGGKDVKDQDSTGSALQAFVTDVDGDVDRVAAGVKNTLPVDQNDSVMLPTDDDNGDGGSKNTWGYYAPVQQSMQQGQEQQPAAVAGFGSGVLSKSPASGVDQTKSGKSTYENSGTATITSEGKTLAVKGTKFAMGREAVALGGEKGGGGGGGAVNGDSENGAVTGVTDKLKVPVLGELAPTGGAAGAKQPAAVQGTKVGRRESFELFGMQRVAAAQTNAPAKPADAPTAAGQPKSPVEQPAAAQANRKVIRNGEMTFEVDGYDSAVIQISKIAQEEGGFIATTESEKLPNGKVKGTVTVRCPPERLDTLVLKLRGLGDLKNSRIAAQDVTKHYTDLDAQLRAAKTMEERLIEIIKSGKGEVKDLIVAEQQLGTYREKIEKLEGEIRYYNNLISLSTLTVTLAERDVRAASLLSETEQVNMGVEAEDVEKARNEAIKAITEAKGRIVGSDLKKHDAGQFAANITADISPDAAGAVTDRLKQLGRVARLEVQRSQTTPEGTGSPVPGTRVERKDTRLVLSIYNLANVAPRNSTSMSLAAEDVEKSYRAVLAQIESAGGRVINSQLAKPTPEQTTGTITFETPAAAADVLLAAVRGAGEVMRLDTSTNPDTQNTTDAKRGFSVQIRSLATVPPRETTNLRIAARNVPESFNKLREAVREKGGRILTSELAEQDKNNVAAKLSFEVKRENWPAVEAALGEAGTVLSRNVNRSADAQNSVDSKLLFQLDLADERTVPPRESIALNLAVDDVTGKYETLLDALRDAGARVLESQINAQDPSKASATLAIDVRRDNRAAVDKALTDAGGVYGRTVSRPAEGQAALEDKVRLSVTMNDIDNLAPRETTTIGIETREVNKAIGDIEATALALGGRKVDSAWAQEPGGKSVARIEVDVPLARAGELLAKARDQGTVLSLQRVQSPNAPEGAFARARLSATVGTPDAIVQGDQSFIGSIRSGLATSVQWLLKSVTLIVIGLCLVGPWALIVWVIARVVRNRRKSRETPPAGGPATVPAA